MVASSLGVTVLLINTTAAIKCVIKSSRIRGHKILVVTHQVMSFWWTCDKFSCMAAVIRRFLVINGWLLMSSYSDFKHF